MKLDNPFILAPMAGITDMPFRRLMKQMGAGCVISEFVSAHAVVHSKANKNRYLKFHEEESPFGFQLFGGDEDKLVEAAKKVEALGADFVDLNFGCPVPKVTKKGGGSAWLCHPLDLAKLLGRIKKAIEVPLTIKIRTGWDSQSINAQEIVSIAEAEGVEWVAVHGRTRAQGYAGSANWQFISELVSNNQMKIVGNGDIVTGALAAAMYLRSGCHGVMIGRGALKNPWIFMEAVEALEKLQNLDQEKRESVIDSIIATQSLPAAGDVPQGKEYYQKKVKQLQPVPVDFVADWARVRKDRDLLPLINLHLGYLREVYPEQRAQLNFRKFLAWYSAGYPGSHKFRKDIFTSKDFDQVIQRALSFFDGVKSLGETGDQIRESAPVLMRGHG